MPLLKVFFHPLPSSLSVLSSHLQSDCLQGFLAATFLRSALCPICFSPRLALHPSPGPGVSEAPGVPTGQQMGLDPAPQASPRDCQTVTHFRSPKPGSKPRARLTWAIVSSRHINNIKKSLKCHLGSQNLKKKKKP